MPETYYLKPSDLGYLPRKRVIRTKSTLDMKGKWSKESQILTTSGLLSFWVCFLKLNAKLNKMSYFYFYNF
jgi:hypothetical protein